MSRSEQNLESSESDNTSDYLQKKPFRLFDLPRELRDRIYHFALVRPLLCIVPNECCYNEKPESNIHYRLDLALCPNPPYMKILRANHQTYKEAKHIFYSWNMFNFDSMAPHYKGGFEFAAYFLRDQPDDVKIRQCGIVLLEQTDANTGRSMMDGDNADLEIFCQMLQTRCNVQFLQLSIYSHLTADAAMAQIPSWVAAVISIGDLTRLRIIWKQYSTNVRSRATTAIQLMRHLMLKGGHLITDDTSIVVRERHSTVDMDGRHVWAYTNYRDADGDFGSVGRRNQRRYLSVTMDVENGKSLLKPMRRSKVLPHVWCCQCGSFYSVSRDCGCWNMELIEGEVGHVTLRDDAPEVDRISAEEDHISVEHDTSPEEENTPLKEEGTSPEEDDTSYGKSIGSHDRVWDSKNWWGGPLEDYLPKGMTSKDFFHAKSLADEGFELHLTPPPWRAGYCDSDFGDSDSVLSLRDLDDGEGDDDDNDE